MIEKERSRKSRFERNTALQFLLPYNHATGSAFEIIRQGIPQEPDVLCRDTVTLKPMGIEVVTVYHDNCHAKSVWTLARGEPTVSYSLTRPDSIENPRILSRVLREIRKKAKKSYENHGGTILLVQIYPWRVYLSDVEERLATLLLPKLHPFAEIFLASQYEIFQLYPLRQWIYP